ncbi:low temperature requirement protein A [Kitasatospora sp. YST-16]|uniref:low temperature requirement protein A n=1 Tax=unclassified Kitasatospora TaxID=2633591 RepID=UPI000689CD8D|nr:MULTISPECIES: low temperature requirement protein A [unclassified Kitasatospora]WAL71893.1 low temperature requirement protein A [Kitasatospora sp. YST-16]WNW37937.1 low temperature requirement protein A [Streptomyces sp. Li-HN-5-13]
MSTAPDPYRPVRRMRARDRRESHRVSTPLELFFDLCFVVAIAQAGRELAHALAEGHYAAALTGYAMAFFAVWWAWMNFTWFASAYDVDDVPYRLTTLVQITGVLVLAAGVPRIFEDQDLVLGVAGYVLMRLAMVTQWLRAARGESGPARTCALRYAVGISVVQVFWVVLLFLPHGTQGPLFPLGVLVELAVPVWAEKDNQTPWHRHHIVERYGLFTIIVLGETVAAATVAVQAALDEHRAVAELLPIAAGGLLICFGAWWIYFADDSHDHLRDNRQALPWGYGHYLVFASAAAVGAGLEVAAGHAVGTAHLSARAASAAVTVPTALFLVTVWALHSRHHKRGAAQAILPLAALSVLAATLAGESAVLIAGLLVALAVATGLILSAKRS